MNIGHYLIGLVAICVLYVGIYAGLNKFSQDRIVGVLAETVDEKKTKDLEERINFNKVRMSSKLDLKEKVSDLTVIDHYVQPEFIDPLFMLKEYHFVDFEARDFVRDIAFDGPFRFSVTLGYPRKEGSDEIVTLNEQMSQVKVFLHLEGWTWKIFKVEVPDFLVPNIKFTPEQIAARTNNA